MLLIVRQGVLFAILVASGAIKDNDNWSVENKSTALQDFIICIEMFFLAIAFTYSFPWAEYVHPDAVPFLRSEDGNNIRPLIHSTSDVLNLKDTVDDTYNTFHPDTISQSFPVVKDIREKTSSVGKRLSTHMSKYYTPGSYVSGGEELARADRNASGSSVSVQIGSEEAAEQEIDLNDEEDVVSGKLEMKVDTKVGKEEEYEEF
tara:strand:+ start:314 stop:925 length:612 start_codon:yes stop_codon:yes gene_type:complete